jgi:hypothetical protein
MVSNIDNAGVRIDDQLSRQETNMNAGLERLDESVKQALALKDDFWFDVHSRWEAVLSGDWRKELGRTKYRATPCFGCRESASVLPEMSGLS